MGYGGLPLLPLLTSNFDNMPMFFKWEMWRNKTSTRDLEWWGDGREEV